MYRIMLSVIALSTTLGVSAGAVRAESSLGDGLLHRFERSRIGVNNPSDAGRVVKRGTILVLQVEGVW